MSRSTGFDATRIALQIAALLFHFSAHSQQVHSAQAGSWNSPDTWSGGVVPDSSNATIIIIDHPVVIPDGYAVSTNELYVNDTLVVSQNAALSLLNTSAATDMQVNGKWIVYGAFIQHDDAVVNGTSAENSRFIAGSDYYYRWNTAGILPVVSWDETATFHITSFDANASVTSDTWTQTFGNVIYDCPSQGNFTDFNGRLRNIQGDFKIRSTNHHILRLARGHSFTLNVGGHFCVEGPSEVWLGETGSPINIFVGKNFEFRAQATASSYLTLSGITTLHVAGDFICDASYKLKFASSGGGKSAALIKGNIEFLSGTIDALGTGSGFISFEGDSIQRYERTADAFFEGNFDFAVESTSTLDLGASLLYNTTGSLDVFGKLKAGSTCSAGAIQGGMNSNTNIADGITFHSGSALEFNGNGAQFIGNVPGIAAADVLVVNPMGVTLLVDMTMLNVKVSSGFLNAGAHSLTMLGDAEIGPGAELRSEGTLICSAIGDQTLDLKGSSLLNLTLTGMNRRITFPSATNVRGLISFEGTGLILSTGDSLRLQSTSLIPGGRIGPLIDENSIRGKVTFERFMPSGRAYRYISFPVSGAAISDLMDDFPITGSFNDPTTGPGINSFSPSFFYYDGSLQSWKNYPSGGAAYSNVLAPGRGYSAFIRSSVDPVIWDLTGEINQGDITLPVASTDGGSPAWNLVGNPYPCSIRWNNAGWTKSGVSPGIAVKDNSTGSFRIWDGAVGDLDDGIIAAGQAFWVRTTAENPALITTESTKQTNTGNFYRLEAEVDYIKIKISQLRYVDHAYLRRRDGSSAGLDAFDIPKLKSDNLSISINAIDQQRMALSAQDIINCVHQERLEISSANATDTVYVDLIPYGVFLGSRLSLFNSATSEGIPRNAEGRFILPSTVRSLILMVESLPAVRPEVTSLPFICDGHQVILHINNGDTGNWSRVEEYIDRTVSDLGTATHDSLVFTFNHEMSYRIITESACNSDTLQLRLAQQLPERPQAVEQIHCGPGSVTLELAPKPDFEHHWYSAMGRRLFTGDTFTTPYLTKDTQYRLTVCDVRSGCESTAAHAQVRIGKLDSLHIFQKNDSLVVNGASFLEWFWNDEPLPWKTAEIPLGNPGVYTARTAKSTGLCVSEASYTFGGLNRIAVFPNPAKDHITYSAPEGDVILKDIVSTNGVSVLYLCKQVCSSGECRLEVASLPAGAYFLIFNCQESFLEPVLLFIKG